MKNRGTFVVLLALLWQLACTTVFALTIQAEQAHVKTVGDISRDAWNLWSNGDWADFIHFAKPGTYKVRVTCFGSPVNNIWPEMAFSVDGSIVQTVTVVTNKPAEYAFDFNANSADYRVGVSFLNDAVTSNEDRNLYIVAMSVEPSPGGPDPVLTSEQAWRGP